MATPNVERTFMVNILAHVLLVDLILSNLKSGAHVVTIGSGTHNPDDKIAKLFGFRGAYFPGAKQVTSGDLGTTGKPQQLNMDRYATSKLSAIYQALDLSREYANGTCSFYAFDPGLMPGTGLARDRSVMEQFGWKYVMPALRHFLPGVSSSELSAKALVQHCILHPEHPSGSYVEFTGKLAPRSKLSENNNNAADLMSQCRALLKSEH
jgi:protochlorophyllide reductase